VLLPTSPVLHLVQHIRDEAHRFAITYHRGMRGRAITASVLDAIPGVGPIRKRRLLRQFGSVAALASASIGEVARVGRCSPTIATAILSTLNTQGHHRD
jgi:excinuclease ABC subunit C